MNHTYSRATDWLIAIVVLSLSGMGNAAEKDISNIGSCLELNGNRTLSLVLIKTNQAEGILRPRPDICESLKKFTAANQNVLVLTTLRSNKKYSICLGKSYINPCATVIADVEPGASASEALQFAYGVDHEQAGPQQQTVERLFIKPSRIIR